MIKEFVKENYIWIFITVMYIVMTMVIIDSALQIFKGKMIIDYVFDWFERRKK